MTDKAAGSGKRKVIARIVTGEGHRPYPSRVDPEGFAAAVERVRVELAPGSGIPLTNKEQENARIMKIKWWPNYPAALSFTRKDRHQIVIQFGNPEWPKPHWVPFAAESKSLGPVLVWWDAHSAAPKVSSEETP